MNRDPVAIDNAELPECPASRATRSSNSTQQRVLSSCSVASRFLAD
jgi:hypothetical protein